MDYAVVKTGGKQYRVSQGDIIDVERLAAEEGGTIELADVLLLSQAGKVTVGTPAVAGAKVVAQVEKQGRGEKVYVFRFKAKTRQGKKTGHRQALTRLRITDIVLGDMAEHTPRRRRAHKAAEAAEASEHGA